MDLWGFETFERGPQNRLGLFNGDGPPAVGAGQGQPPPEQPLDIPQLPPQILAALEGKIPPELIQRLKEDPSARAAVIVAIGTLQENWLDILSQDTSPEVKFVEEELPAGSKDLKSLVDALLRWKRNADLKKFHEEPKGEYDAYIPGLRGDQAKFKEWLKQMTEVHAWRFGHYNKVTQVEGRDVVAPNTRLWGDITRAYNLAREIDGAGPNGRKDGWITAEELKELQKPEDREMVRLLAVLTQKVLPFYRERHPVKGFVGREYKEERIPAVGFGYSGTALKMTLGGRSTEISNLGEFRGDKRLYWEYRVDDLFKSWWDGWRYNLDSWKQTPVVEFTPPGQSTPVKMSGIMGYRYQLRETRNFLEGLLQRVEKEGAKAIFGEDHFMSGVASDEDRREFDKVVKERLVAFRDFLNQQMESYRVDASIERFEKRPGGRVAPGGDGQPVAGRSERPASRTRRTSATGDDDFAVIRHNGR